MNLKIKLIPDRETDGSAVFLINTLQELEKLQLTQDEKEYVEAQFSQKKSVVFINRFNSSIVVVLLKGQEEEWKRWEEARKKANSTFVYLEKNLVEEVTFISFSDKDANEAFLEGMMMSHYQFVKYFKKPLKRTLKTIYCNADLEEKSIDELINLSMGVSIARNFVNEPVCELNAPEFANRMKSLCEEAGCKVQVKGKDWIKIEKMGGLLAVNKGSIDPPRFTIIEWLPLGKENNPPTVIVGKGIVYDTGGLSLKTSQYMETMKSDMGGAAAVAGLMYSLAKNNVQKNVVALIPSTDNRPDGNAYVPGDIVKMRNGLFVEVINTDAEGRMILADALDYANVYKPKLIIDIATLTGAANLALAEHGVVAMGTASDKLFHKLDKSGYRKCERIVRFPFWDEYEELIASDVADIKNVGGPLAGSITAGKFLAHFVNGEWIHIDISGSAFVRKNFGYKGKGATGFGVRLLYDFICSL